MTESKTYPRVILADGTVLNADAGFASGNLCVWMREANDPDNDLIRLASVFLDKQKTGRIRFEVAAEASAQEWDGMTRLVEIKVDGEGKISVRMRREADV